MPKGADLRPTPDRVRETVFNWLAPVLPGARCLDLYAGTGVLGLEALSRGAMHAVFVERETGTAGTLSRLITELEANAEVVCDDAADYLDRADLSGFDIVFVDPPYETPVEPLIDALSKRLRSGSRVYLERDAKDSWPASPAFEWTRQAEAGAVAFGIGQHRTTLETCPERSDSL